MNNFVTVLRFGAPYLRPYLVRLVLGLILGIVFGLSNAAILGSTKALLNRMFPEAAAEASAPKPKSELRQRVDAQVEPIKQSVTAVIDPWLPSEGKKLDAKQALGVLVLIPLLFAFRGYVGFLSSYCLRWVSERVITDLRQEVFEKLNSLSVDFFNRSTMGELISHVLSDTQSIQRSLNHGVSDLVKEPMTIISTFFVMVWIDWQLTLFVMVFLPICIVPMLVLGRKVRKATRENRKQNANQASLLVEALASIRVIKAFSLEQEQLSRFAQFSRVLLRNSMKSVRAKELINPFIETIGAVGVGILIVYILWAQKSGADLAIFIGAVMTIYTPVKNIGKLHVMFQEARIGVDRIRDLMAEQPTVLEPAKPVPFKPFAREVRFENVTFGYGDKIVLKDFNLTIPRGLKLGVAGESGAGKSTLINLLYRFYDPQKGRITIDGEDIRNLKTEDLRRHLALVSQEIVLFDQDVAENIACGKKGATRAEVEVAGRAAYAHNFIQELPNGYETRVGERGVMLSGGQRQRIAIARAFIRQAPILALDEATASLDAQAEMEVQAAIESVAQERTVISVAHRLSTLANMDEIIFLSQGKIVERGSFEELLRLNGGFAALARRQGIWISNEKEPAATQPISV